ncbi:DUF4852 domain-containing protein [Saccharophagus sp. K07]|uniref:DUF4852 domain-containing protein n=1 Tax=Saccharophagus sp. K07 TaxID=2283636 RepID=UPI001652042B|nr:DUF4852 domain-containing protein [Saccharophagus sp. K07]MBC6905254.1 DUF4852 domain-containing protein [Saccharophagus sp. K07]
MKALRITAIFMFAINFSGCASNGSHIYLDGKCISCWNNPVTKETLDYETAGANNYAELSWQDMMLEGLSRSGIRDLSPYGEDYLRHRIGNKVVSLRNNEISYQRHINQSVSDLESALEAHTLKKTYQITVSSQLENYDFSKNEFPVMLAKSFTLNGGNNIQVLPGKITVNVDNLSELPNLEMSPEEAESFLNARNKSRGLYIRYIVEITGMSSPSVFQSRVREIQFIDVNPNIVTRENKEKHQPFRAVRI